MLDIEKSNQLSSQVYRDCLVIREDVFVREQNVPIDLEIEGEEGPMYYCGYINEKAVSCARVTVEENGAWHIQRVATIEAFRKQGFSSQIIKAIIEDAKKAQVTEINLGAQDQAQEFYVKLGFKVVGEGFEDAGIAHHKMVMTLQ
ncbi:GNAT family N-acetyltransferase [Ligilactobacillus hayakitensis]|nr:GNAT family N-acetyltransferase [Ligilactobacillus hayakitensis]